MEILVLIVLLAAVLNFLLGIFVFIKDPLRRINRLFGISGFITAAWVLTNFIFYFKGSPDLFLLKCGYAFGALVPLSAVLWGLELCDKRITKRESFLLFGLGIFFFSISYINGLVVSNVKIVYLGGFEGETGPFFVSYWIYIFGLLAYIVYILISSYFEAEGTKKIQISYVLIGAVLYIGTVLLVSFILPSLGILKFTAFDAPSSIFLLIFTALAITRYHLFEIRVILTELLVGVIAIILLVQALTAPTFWLKVFGFLLFILFGISGYLLVKSVLKEIEYREELRVAKENIERAYEVEKKAHEELKKLDEAKDQFILITQHHLRTPLTSMLGYISMALEGDYGEISERLKKPLLNFQKSTKDLIKLVNEFLDIYQFRLGKGIFVPKEIKIEDLLSEICLDLKPEAEKKGIYLKFEKQPAEVLPKIKADTGKLKMAIYNIVDNGLKYTEKGGVTIRCKIIDNRLQIKVEDTGIGMTEEEINTLFTGFFKRSEEAKKVYATGRGIGLFLSYQIIQSHRGRVWAESEGKGKGSTFYIELPIK